MWDIINYLKVTFAQLEQLPTVVKEAVHFASCIHICKSIEQVLSGSVVKKLNAAGIANFKRNLDALLDFVGSIPIQQLREVFLALTQLVELLLSGGADKFLDPQQREAGKYSHLSVETVATVLDKIKEHKLVFGIHCCGGVHDDRQEGSLRQDQTQVIRNSESSLRS